ncbi:MAG: hypothetical protein N2Z59_07410 [Alteraurantiacibacter sp.]|nr:hypothetical protein [Alteraurantiacibacter sp.]
MNQPPSSRKLVLIGAGAVGLAALAVLVVLPAETGWDPTGVGKALGLVEIAEPVNPEFVRGQERMARQQVLVLSESAPTPEPGVTDVFEYELAPYDSIELKYTMAEGGRMAFRWESTGPLNYDMHSHPFEGGTDLTESFAIGKAGAAGGLYIAPFTGIHGWYWQNRSTDNVTLRLAVSGAMTASTLFSRAGEIDRPLQGAETAPPGTVEGHAMRSGAAEGE